MALLSQLERVREFKPVSRISPPSSVILQPASCFVDPSGLYHVAHRNGSTTILINPSSQSEAVV